MGKKIQRKTVMNRSDIPYAQRMLMQKHQTVADHRNEAAMIALQIGCVALNDTEGLGYQRLSRFAKHMQELVREYYEDPEVGAAHLKARLEQLGFMVDENGHMYCVEDTTTGQFVSASKLLEQKAR